MAKHWKRILSFILALALTVTGITFSGPIIVRAADSAEMTTEDIDDPVEETVNAEVWFVQSATGKNITLDGVENNPIDCKLCIIRMTFQKTDYLPSIMVNITEKK